jgi:general secretion pathway protein C
MIANPIARSFYVAHLILITGLAYVAADIADESIRNRLEGTPKLPRTGISVIHKSTDLPTEEDLRTIASRNPFSPEDRGIGILDASLNLDDASPSTDGGGSIVPVGDWTRQKHLAVLKPESIKLRLVGTLLAAGTLSGAVIQSIGKEDQKFYHINQDIVPGRITLMYVRKDSVILRVGGDFGVLKAQYDNVDDSGQTLNASRSGNETPHGIRKLDDHHWLIESRAIQFAMKNLNSLMMQARAIPNFNAGHVDGFKLIAIQPGSLYQEVGLVPGDIIRSINGMSMSDPQNFVKAISTLGASTQVQVDLIRNGTPQTFDYQIR